MSWIEEEYLRYSEMMEEAYARISASFDAQFEFGAGYVRHVPAASNTFRSCPEPRAGYIDARRDDGCVAIITDLA